jgi:hypothetical protein
MAEFRVVALSETGAALAMDMPMAVGSRCDLSLNLAERVVDLAGRVAYVKPPESRDGPYLVGVDFEGVDELDAGLLGSFLEEERRRSP